MNDLESGGVLDLVLTQAAREAACELGESLVCPAEKTRHSRGYSRAMAPLSRIGPGPARLPIFRWAACIMAALLVGSVGTAMSVEAVREQFISYFFDKDAPSTKFSFNLNPGTNYNGKVLTLGYLPNGFKCTDDSVNYNQGEEYLYFERDDGKYFWVDMYDHNIKLNYDTENAELETIEINGYDAIIITKTYIDGGIYHSIIWSNGNCIFDVFGNISKREILKVANNIAFI